MPFKQVNCEVIKKLQNSLFCLTKGGTTVFKIIKAMDLEQHLNGSQ